MSDALVEDELDGHARIRAGQHGGERLLFVDGFGLEYVEVFRERCQAALDEAPIAVDQLLQCRLGAQRSLRPDGGSRDEPRDSGYRNRCQRFADKSTPGMEHSYTS